jgi:thiol-disulfide isomerase/thioredoxin
LEPEQTLAIELDIIQLLQTSYMELYNNGFKAMEFIGPLAPINKELQGYHKKPEFTSNYSAFQKKLLTLLPEEFKTERLQKQHDELAEVDAYAHSNSISEKANQILREAVLLECGTNLFDFVMNRDYKARNTPDNKVLQQKEEQAYYDFLRDFPLNNQSLLLHGNYSTFINRFEFCNPISIYPKTRHVNMKPEKNLLEFFEEEGIEISKEYKDLYSLILNEPTKVTPEFLEENKAKLEAFNEKHKESITAYSDKYIKPLNALAKENKISLDKWNMRDSVLTNTLKLDNSLTYEITKTRSLEFEIKRSTKELAEEYWSRQQKNISHPFLIEEGERMVKKIFPDSDARAYVLPAGKATDVFKDIIDPFKGKILFVDFWATSCGPCVGGIKRMKETREKHKGNKDFDFIFITDERSSPEKRYTDFVAEQELENTYRLSRDDYNYLRELFKFNGIPRYVVIDKQGNVINDDFSMHSFKHELKGILEENK